jgi:hypothetical protein
MMLAKQVKVSPQAVRWKIVAATVLVSLISLTDLRGIGFITASSLSSVHAQETTWLASKCRRATWGWTKRN